MYPHFVDIAIVTVASISYRNSNCDIAASL